MTRQEVEDYFNQGMVVIYCRKDYMIEGINTIKDTADLRRKYSSGLEDFVSWVDTKADVPFEELEI